MSRRHRHRQASQRPLEAVPAREPDLGEHLTQAALNLGLEGVEDACDLGDAMASDPVPTATTTVLATVLFILIPVIPALIGTLHICGSSARGITRQRRRMRSG